MIKIIITILLLLMLDNNIAKSSNIGFSLSKSMKFDNSEKKSLTDQTGISHIKEMKALGIEGATVYYNLMSKGNKKDPIWWIKKYYLDKDIPTNIVLILKKEGSSSLEAINSGYFDHDLVKFAKKVSQYKKEITLTILHESNGGWYPWGACYGENSYEDLVKAYEKINNILIQNNARKSINLTASFNRRGCDGVFELGDQYLPNIDPIIDSYSISTYNRCGTSKTYKKEVDFETDFKPAYERLSEFTQKPINLGEVATSGLCGDSLSWYTQMFSSLAKYPQVKYINFFFGDIPVGYASNEIPFSWGFKEASKLSKFNELLHKFKTDPSQLRTKELKIPQSQKKKISYKYPWDIQVWTSIPSYAPYSPSVNRFTGSPFGSRNASVLAIANQRLLIEANEDLLVGPGIKVTQFWSGNKNQWWSNQMITELNFAVLIKQPLKHKKIIWSQIRAESYINYNFNFAPSPEYSSGIEAGLRIYFGTGGDWSQ